MLFFILLWKDHNYVVYSICWNIITFHRPISNLDLEHSKVLSTNQVARFCHKLFLTVKRVLYNVDNKGLSKKCKWQSYFTLNSCFKAILKKSLDTRSLFPPLPDTDLSNLKQYCQSFTYLSNKISTLYYYINNKRSSISMFCNIFQK